MASWVLIGRILYRPKTRKDHLLELDVSKLSVPDPVCDSCNTPLLDKTWILMLSPGHPWGALCEECKSRYQSKLSIIRVEDAELGIIG